MKLACASLQKIDSHPAYVMTYDGDYALDEAVAKDIRSGEDVEKHIRTVYQSGFPVNKTFSRHRKACTGFSTVSGSGECMVGHNEDWMKSKYLILFTKPLKGYSSVSLVGVESLKPGYKELILTPFYPLAGMNSSGLTVTTYSVPECKVPESEGKPYVLWTVAIRMILDKAATLDEALSVLDSINIIIEKDNYLQFMIADAEGHSAIVEWIDGKTIVIRKNKHWQAVTNFIQFNAPESDFQQCRRYTTAKDSLDLHANEMSAMNSFLLLEATAQWERRQGGTQFSILFNQTAKTIQIAFGRKFAQMHYFSLEK